jgi:hypothetical protein
LSLISRPARDSGAFDHQGEDFALSLGQLSEKIRRGAGFENGARSSRVERGFTARG